jgi:hypothetical protein
MSPFVRVPGPNGAPVWKWRALPCDEPCDKRAVVVDVPVHGIVGFLFNSPTLLLSRMQRQHRMLRVLGGVLSEAARNQSQRSAAAAAAAAAAADAAAADATDFHAPPDVRALPTPAPVPYHEHPPMILPRTAVTPPAASHTRGLATRRNTPAPRRPSSPDAVVNEDLACPLNVGIAVPVSSGNGGGDTTRGAAAAASSSSSPSPPSTGLRGRGRAPQAVGWDDLTGADVSSLFDSDQLGANGSSHGPSSSSGPDHEGPPQRGLDEATALPPPPPPPPPHRASRSSDVPGPDLYSSAEGGKETYAPDNEAEAGGVKGEGEGDGEGESTSGSGDGGPVGRGPHHHRRGRHGQSPIHHLPTNRH